MTGIRHALPPPPRFDPLPPGRRRDARSDLRKIIIFPLPCETSPEDLREMFQTEIGPVQSTSVVMHQGMTIGEVVFLRHDACKAESERMCWATGMKLMTS